MVVAGLTAYLRGVEGRLREAELAQARAETRAAGERRRRLLTLALAGSMLATVLIGAAGWGWMERERQAARGSSRCGGRRRPSPTLRRNASLPEPPVATRSLGRGDRGRSPCRVAPWCRRPGQRATRSRPRFRHRIGSRARCRRGGREGSPFVERLAGILNDLGVDNDEAKTDAEFSAAFRAYGVDLISWIHRRPARAPPLARLPRTWRAPSISGLSCVEAEPSTTPPARDRLVAVARATDPDPWRNGLRDTLAGWRAVRPAGSRPWRGSLIPRMSTAFRWRALPGWPPSLSFLGRGEKAIGLLRRAQASHRDDFWVNADLGRDLMASGRADEAVRFFTVAAGVRPKSGIALNGLGKSLLLSGQAAEAADVFSEMIRLRPEEALSHVALGSAPSPWASRTKRAPQFGEAKRLKPDDWVVRDQIALAYSECGEWNIAVREQTDAARRFPKSAVAHKAIADALQSAGRIEDAIAEFREAVRLTPRFSSAYLFLGPASLRPALSIARRACASRRGTTTRGPGSPPSGELSTRARELMTLEARYPAVVEGAELPVDAEEASRSRIAFARHDYPSAARLWADSFTSSPEHAADLTTANRFQAARAAALAAREPERGDSPSDPESPARWRKQALDWLSADLTASAAAAHGWDLPAASSDRETVRSMAGRPGFGRYS